MSRRLLKDHVFMAMAQSISELGTCCRLKVGALLLRPDGGIASAGFNGALPGMPHCTEATCNPSQRCLHTSHAEENALGFCAGEVSTAYVTHEPCLTCTRALVRRGVRRVVFGKPYTSIADQERHERDMILQHFRVSWEQYVEPDCDCFRHEKQVCDICQGVEGSKPAGTIPLTDVLDRKEHAQLILEEARVGVLSPDAQTHQIHADVPRIEIPGLSSLQPESVVEKILESDLQSQLDCGGEQFDKRLEKVQDFRAERGKK